MIDRRSITTYAQYNEDVILLALLGDVEKGFYVDVGANYPTVDSVTKLFYQKGWRGINIEPVKSLYKQLAAARKRDINLNCGAGEKKGALTLREYVDVPGHSTFAGEQKDQHAGIRHADYEVEIKTLAEIFTEQKVAHIHFLKIDVEGFEDKVVKGNDWKKYRPEVLCIEANHIAHDWRPLLLGNDYRLFITDGLNEYYVAREAWHRTDGFAERAIKIDYYALKQHQYVAWSADSKRLETLEDLNRSNTLRIHELEEMNGRLRRLSLSDRSLAERIKRSGYGLTIDWVRYVRARLASRRGNSS